MVNFRGTVTLFCLAAAANATNIQHGKRLLAVRDSNDSALDASSPLSTTEVAPVTTAAADEQTPAPSPSYTWAPTTTAAAAQSETTTDEHDAPMTPIVESSQTGLDGPSTSAAAVSTTEAVATPSESSQSWVYSPTTTPAEAASTTQYLYAPTTDVPISSSATAFTWAPTTTEDQQQQPTFTYAPASSSSSSDIAPVIIPVATSSAYSAPFSAAAPIVESSAQNLETPSPSSSGNVPLFYTGPAETTTQGAPTWATSAAVAQTSAAAPAEHTSISASPYNKPEQSASLESALTIGASSVAAQESGASKIPAAVTTPGAPVPTTFASLSVQTICPTDDASCHTVVVTPRPATATNSVSTDNGILVFNGHTMSMSAVTLAAAPAKNTGVASGSAGSSVAAGSTGTASIQKGAASRVGMGMGGLLGFFAIIFMML